MFRPLFFAPLALCLVLLQQVPTTSGTFAITAVSAVGLLGIKAKLLGAYLLSRRGKRSAEEEQDLPTLEPFATLEVEDCYKRVICAASTGELKNHQVENVLALSPPSSTCSLPS